MNTKNLSKDARKAAIRSARKGRRMTQLEANRKKNARRRVSNREASALRAENKAVRI